MAPASLIAKHIMNKCDYFLKMHFTFMRNCNLCGVCKKNVKLIWFHPFLKGVTLDSGRDENQMVNHVVFTLKNMAKSKNGSVRPVGVK